MFRLPQFVKALGRLRNILYIYISNICMYLNLRMRRVNNNYNTRILYKNYNLNNKCQLPTVIDCGDRGAIFGKSFFLVKNVSCGCKT